MREGEVHYCVRVDIHSQVAACEGRVRVIIRVKDIDVAELVAHGYQGVCAACCYAEWYTCVAESVHVMRLPRA